MTSIEIDELKHLIDAGRDSVLKDNVIFTRFVLLVTNCTDITQSDLVRQTQLNLSTFNKRINRKLQSPFTPPDRAAIWEYCFGKRHLKETIDNAILTKTEQFEVDFYKSFLLYYDISHAAIRNIENNILGTFVLWRWSTEIGGDPAKRENRDVVRGKIVFAKDDETKCMKASMYQALRDMSDGKIEHQTPSCEIYDGFLFQRSNKHIMILRKKKSPDFRVTVFYSAPTDTASGENLTFGTLAIPSKSAQTLACSRYHPLRSHH
jgi:hypothetical protein